MSLRYRCDGCGHEQEPGERWLAVRIAGDRRGLEIRTIGNGGPDDRFFCSEACAFKRISEVLRGPQPAPASKPR